MVVLDCWLIASAAALFVAVADAFKPEQFKTCQQNPFCRRNRESALNIDNGNDGRKGWMADAMAKGSQIAFQLNKENAAQLEGSLWVYREGILRLTIDEPDRPIKRFRPVKGEITLEDTNLQLETRVEIAKKPDSSSLLATFPHGTSHISVKIDLATFAISIFRDGHEILGLNKHGLFNFETWNPPPPPPKKSTESDENFGENDEEIDSNNEIEETTKPPPPFDRDTEPEGPASISLDLTLPRATQLYGLSERAGRMVLEDTRGEGVVKDPYRLFNLDVFEYLEDHPMGLYGSVPMIVGRGPEESLALFWNNPSDTCFDIVDASPKSTINKGNGNNRFIHGFSETGILDLFIYLGPSIKASLGQHALVTGTPQLPPLFSLGYHQCRWNYRDQADVLAVNAAFDQYAMPMDVIWLDIEHTRGKRYFTWDPALFPNPRQMQAKLAERGRKLVTIVDPHLKKDGGFKVYTEVTAKGLTVKTNDGVGTFEGDCWPGTSVWADYLNPRVRAWWAGLFGLDRYEGSTEGLFIWNDMNEPSVFGGPEGTFPKDNRHLIGDATTTTSVEHRAVHNLYGHYMHRATFQGLEARTKSQRPFLLTRSFYAGSQRFGAVWTGDNAATWNHLGLTVPMLLTLSLTGISFAGADVGGFFGNPPSPELLVRWYQTGALQPFFRAHAHIDTKRREPWLFGEPYTGIIREALRLRYSLLPHIYTLAYEASLVGLPIMRPLVVEFEGDPVVAEMDDQFLLGHALLHKPIAVSGAMKAKVYLPPAAKWYDYFSLEVRSGGWWEPLVDLSQMLLFVRGGSVIARKTRPRRSSSQMYRDPYSLLIALDKEKSALGTVYIDDGHTYDYQKGAYIYRTIRFSTLKSSSTSTTFRIECQPLGVGNEKRKDQLDPSISTKVEEIVIVGFDGDNSGQKTLSASVNKSKSGTIPILLESNNRLILKLPNVDLASTWQIDISHE